MSSTSSRRWRIGQRRCPALDLVRQAPGSRCDHRRGPAPSPSRSCRRRRARRSCARRSRSARAAPRRAVQPRRSRQPRSCGHRTPHCANRNLSRRPTSTWHQRIDLPLEWTSTSYATTLPITNGPVTSAPTCSTVSTSSPALISASARVRPSRSSGRRRTREASSAAPSSRRSDQGSAEADVAFDHVAHVLGVVTEHQSAVHAHAEGEAGVDVGVDAAGLEDARVDDPAATPFDPALALAGTAGIVGITD